MADIQKIAVFDERIVQRSPVQYAVEQGAQSATNTSFPALSQSTSQHTYQIQVPSENVFLDKAIDWTSTVFLKLTVVPNTVVNGDPVLVLGDDASLAAWPLHQLISTMSSTINDTTVSINTSDVLPQLLRMADSAKNRQLRTCPTYLDTYRTYNDAINTTNNPLAGYALATTNNPPNGAYWNIDFTNAAGVSILPPTQATGTASYSVYLKFTSTEKLILSPFVFNDVNENETGLFGLQNIQITMNLLQPSLTNTAGRVIRHQDTRVSITNIEYNTTPVNGAFQSSAINALFLSPSLSLPRFSLSRVNYMEFPRYTQNVSGTIASGNTFSGAQSQTITLPCIPDLIIIKAIPTSYAATDGDWNLPITNISVNFDNFSGLLSSFSPEELFSLSCANGLDMTWNEWSGQAVSGRGTKQFVGTVGGFLVLKPSRDITLQTGQAPSNVGNYTFQFNYSVYNPSDNAVQNWNLVVITANSGYFESRSGSSRVVKGVLSTADVIEASEKGPLTRSEVNRYVGGASSGLFRALSTGIQKALPLINMLAPSIKQYIPDVASAIKKNISKRLM